MQNNILIFIPSVVYFKNKALSYSANRSIFTPEERALQTVESIRSVKKHIPQAKIVLIELGLSKELPYDLTKLPDQYLYLGDNFFVRKACDSKFKALGESMALFIAYFKKNKNNFDLYFKLSGRYYINDNFNIENFINGEMNAKVYGNAISTRLYSFKHSFRIRWLVSLFFSMILSFLNISLEKIMFYLIGKKKINDVKLVGVEGLIGPNGEKISE